jgi:hypothetical protein
VIVTEREVGALLPQLAFVDFAAGIDVIEEVEQLLAVVVLH